MQLSNVPKLFLLSLKLVHVVLALMLYIVIPETLLYIFSVFMINAFRYRAISSQHQIMLNPLNLKSGQTTTTSRKTTTDLFDGIVVTILLKISVQKSFACTNPIAYRPGNASGVGGIFQGVNDFVVGIRRGQRVHRKGMNRVERAKNKKVQQFQLNI